jgi:short-subunit dehydrogenase
MGGKIAFPFMSIYHSTKWAVEGFTESLHYEMSLFNVRVKLVEPGPVKTNFYGGSMQFGSKKIKEYDKYFENFQKLSDNAERMGFPPIRTAQEIYRAATDGSWKLRYPSDLGAKSVLLMRKVLPDKLYNSIIRSLSRPR